MQKRVYIAGPLSGLPTGIVNQYRTNIKNTLAMYDISFIDPLCGFDIDNPEQYDPQLIFVSNKYQINISDILLADFTLPEAKTSIGTLGEVIYAHTIGKLVIAIGDVQQLNHPWLIGNIDIISDNLTEACEYISIL